MQIAKFRAVEDVSPASIEAAVSAAHALSRYSSAPMVRLVVEDDATPVCLPADIFQHIVELLAQIANGNAVSIVPLDAELTTQQAAHLLNVSRPHVIKLIESGTLGHRMVGTHRKLLAKEVLDYASKAELAQAEALKKLSLLEAEYGLND